MNGVITYSGFCPTQQKNYSVTRKELDSSTVNEEKITHGLLNCKYAGLNGCSISNKCPLLK